MPCFSLQIVYIINLKKKKHLFELIKIVFYEFYLLGKFDELFAYSIIINKRLKLLFTYCHTVTFSWLGWCDVILNNFLQLVNTHSQ